MRVQKQVWQYAVHYNVCEMTMAESHVCFAPQNLYDLLWRGVCGQGLHTWHINHEEIVGLASGHVSILCVECHPQPPLRLDS